MNCKTGIKFSIFLIALMSLFLFSDSKTFAQRSSGESSIIHSAKNVVRTVAPMANGVYRKFENKNSTVQNISNKLGEAIPLAEKAAPKIEKGIFILKKILKVLKKILR